MTRTADPQTTGIAAARARLAGHLRVPLYRNGYSLAFSTIATSVLGMVFWLVAARMLPAAVVGVDSAIIAASGLLGTIAQLNLTHGLNRFLPRAGSAAGTLIARSYALTAGLGALAGVAFLLGVDWWAPTLSFVADAPPLALWFVVATALTCVFVLQDGALTGLRRAGWVPIENIAYGVAKLGLLVALVITGAQTPIFVAWTAPYVVVLAGVTWLLYRRLLPEHVRATAHRELPVDWGQIRRFVAGDYAASLVSTGLGFLLPIVVLELTGPAPSAYFSLAWTIAYTMFLLSRNMGMSLVAEVVDDGSRLDEYSYAIVLQTGRLLAPPIAVLVLGAPWILRLFGPDYAAGGATLLRLLAFSALPGIITSLFMARSRIQRRMLRLVVVMSALNGGILAGSLLLVPRMGITGVGVAWLAAHVAAALALLATDLRSLWVSRLDHRALAALVRVAHRAGGRRARRERAAHLDAALTAVAAAMPATGPPRIVVVHPTLNSVSVAEVDVPGRGRVVLKLAANELGDRSLEREELALAELQTDPRLEEVGLDLPVVLGGGRHRDRRWIVERHLAHDVDDPLRAADRLADRDDIERLLEPITRLHDATMVTVPVDDEVLHAVVDRPLDLLATAGGKTLPHEATRRLRDELRCDLRARGQVRLARIHGDLAPHNIVVSDSRIRGLLDWEDTARRGLPEIDRCHFAITLQMARSGQELGDVISRLLREDLDGGHPLAWAVRGPNALPARTVLLTTWLHHIGAGIAKSNRGTNSWVWHARNVATVLAAAQARPPVHQTMTLDPR